VRRLLLWVATGGVVASCASAPDRSAEPQPIVTQAAPPWPRPDVVRDPLISPPSPETPPPYGRPLEPLVPLARPASRRDLLRCFERELKRHPGLLGRVEIGVTFDEHGRAIRVRLVRSTIDHLALERCLLSVAARFRREPGRARGEVTFPIVLRSAR
jgi:hypothetical protein